MIAANHTVGEEKQIHSLHSYFLRAGSETKDLHFKVHRDFDGRTVSNRRVVVRQDNKVIFSNTKWTKVNSVIKNAFNRRLPDEKLTVGNFEDYHIPFGRLYGKELMLLLWAIEDAEVAAIDLAIKNWLGLSPEERWWLFTMTNASTGHYTDKRGWRLALRYALTENPVDNKLAGSFVERLV